MEPFAKALCLFTLTILAHNSVMSQIPDGPIYGVTTAEGFHGHVKEVAVRATWFQSDSTTIQQDSIYYRFSEDGLLLQKNNPNPTGHNQFITYHYHNGKLTKVEDRDDDGCLFLYVYLYKTNGCLKEVVRDYYEDDRLVTSDTSTLHCDDLCRIIMEDSVFYTYNNAGLISSRTFLKHQITYEYDTQNRLVKETSIEKESSFSRTTTYSYNETGCVSDVEESFHLSADYTNTKRVHYEYTYDSRGNWVTCTAQGFVMKRKITYYD